MRLKNVALLGGEGFIGLNILSLLASKYDCFSMDKEANAIQDKAYQVVVGDPYQQVPPLKPSVLIHLIDHNISLNSFEAAETQLISNLNVPHDTHVIIFSSAVVYTQPDSDYGRRKILLEKFYEEYCTKNNLPLTIIRLFNVYGFGQHPNVRGGLVATLLDAAMHDETVTINDKQAKRDFVFASDIGRYIDWIIAKKWVGRTDLGTGILTSIEDLLLLLEKEVIRKPIKVIDGEKKEEGVCPSAKNKLLSQISCTPLREGLMKTYASYQQ